MRQDLIRRYSMLPQEGTVLCAVSGGADSMCLLVWLRELSEAYGFTVAAAHYHHGLRGESADRDEAFVRDFCEKEEIPFYAEHGDVAAAAREHGWSVEEAARNLRYDFLRRTAVKIGAVRIATAHNRGDNAETVLMHLIRGTGLTGLVGISPVRDIFIRPLLSTSREEIEGYLAQKGISYVQDETNDEVIFTRNKIRHELMPLLREINPRVEEALNQTAGLLRQDEDYLNRVTERVCKTVAVREQRAALSRAELTDLPEALQSRVIRYMLDVLKVSKKDISARHVQAIRDLARDSGPTAQLSLPRGIIARNEQETFAIYAAVELPWKRQELFPLGDVRIGKWHIRAEVRQGTVEERQGRLILNNAKLTVPVYVDRWNHSGRMTLQGSAGNRSIKRLFVDAGCSIREREETPVIYVGNTPAAIFGIGVDAAFAPTEQDLKYVLDIL